jgi:hypothetical protein
MITGVPCGVETMAGGLPALRTFRQVLGKMPGALLVVPSVLRPTLELLAAVQMAGVAVDATA